ncbi:MAG: RNA polymerase sigma factor [Phycisphaerales bacterium]
MTTKIPQDSRNVFEILVREHADMLIAYIRSLVRDSAAADDVFQESILVAWKRLDDFDRTRPFAPWLRGIAAKCALASFRTGKVRPITSDPAVMDAVSRSFERLNATEGDSFRDRLASLERCLAKLPESMRECVTLAYSRGMLLKHIAESTGEMEETVKKRIQRARQALADCMLGGVS